MRGKVYKALFGVFILLGFYLIIKGFNLTMLLEKESLRAFVSQFGIFSYVVFGLIYIGVSLILFPPSALTIAAGYIFGKVGGTIVVVVSATIVAGIAFIISRHFSHVFYKNLQKGVVKKLVSKIDKQLDKNGFMTFVILRMLFLPYMYLSYAAGLVRKAKFKDFIWATFLTNIIGSFIFVYLGDQLGQGWKALVLPVILVILVLSVPLMIKKFKKH